MTTPKELRSLTLTLKNFKLPPRVIEVLLEAADDLETKQIALDDANRKNGKK